MPSLKRPIPIILRADTTPGKFGLPAKWMLALMSLMRMRRSLNWESGDGLDAESIIYSFSEPLFAAQVLFRSPHRYMTEQELDLLQFASRIVAESCTRPPEIVWCELGNS